MSQQPPESPPPHDPPDHGWDGVLESTIRALSAGNGDVLAKAAAEGVPDRAEAVDWTERIRHLILHQRQASALRAEVPALAERLLRLLRATPSDADAERIVTEFVRRLPEVRARLAEDAEAAFEGDPASKSYSEIVVSYPSIHAVAVHRLAHELFQLGARTLPRMMAEHVHGRTGIDIHPGARIGRRFFIDHGTGVVIGETCQIGDRVQIYQGVTLGALSPRRGERVRGVKRHPTIEDDVTIYAGATILGGETVIGRGSVVGGNVWLTRSLPPGSRVVIEPPRLQIRDDEPHDDEPEPSCTECDWDI